MLQHFKERNDIEDFEGLRAETLPAAARKFCCAGSGARQNAPRSNPVRCRKRSTPRGWRPQKIAGSASYVEQAAAARSERVSEEESVTGLERKNARVAFAVHRGIPARVEQFARIPELQAATGTFVQGVAIKISSMRFAAKSMHTGQRTSGHAYGEFAGVSTEFGRNRYRPTAKKNGPPLCKFCQGQTPSSLSAFTL